MIFARFMAVVISVLLPTTLMAHESHRLSFEVGPSLGRSHLSSPWGWSQSSTYRSFGINLTHQWQASSRLSLGPVIGVHVGGGTHRQEHPMFTMGVPDGSLTQTLRQQGTVNVGARAVWMLTEDLHVTGEAGLAVSQLHERFRLNTKTWNDTWSQRHNHLGYYVGAGVQWQVADHMAASFGVRHQRTSGNNLRARNTALNVGATFRF